MKLTPVQQKVFDAICAAAENDQHCPSANALMSKTGSSHETCRKAIVDIGNMGIIQSTIIDGNRRNVVIVHTGKATKPYQKKDVVEVEELPWPEFSGGDAGHQAIIARSGRKFEDMPVKKVVTIKRNAYASEMELSAAAGRFGR